MPKTGENSLTTAGDSGIIRENSKKPITPITDQAIERVPKVNIDGFTDEQNEFVQRQHQELLRYAKDNNGGNEVAFVFRKGLGDKSIYTGSDDIIDFGNDLYTKGDEIFIMHNHPRNSGFSDRDIRAMLLCENIKTISIVKNSGTIEVLTKANAYNEQSAKTHLMRAYKKFVKHYTDEEISQAIDYYLKNNGGNLLWTRP